MAMFEYRALDQNGRLLVGTMEGAAPSEVVDHLDSIGMTPISTREAKERQSRSWKERLTPEPPPQDITGFTLDLAMLLKGGVSLNDALAILAKMETRRWLVRLISGMHAELSGGKSFSKVLAQHPRLFDSMYVKMIESAEVSGRLQEALASIAVERQQAEKLRKRLIGAMAYPGFLAVAAVGVMVFVLLYIIPQFEGAIAGFRDRIAPSTLFVFQLSEGLRDNLDIFVGAVVLLLVGFVIAKRLAGDTAIGIGLLSVLPLTRRIVSYNMTLTFCRSFATLTENGVDISTTLTLIKGMINVPGAEAKLDAVIADVRGGKRLSEALERTPLLPGHVVQLLQVGEGAGDLAGSARRVAEFYETKLDASLTRLTAILGPLLMMIVSLLVGWLIISVMSALMSINDLLL